MAITEHESPRFEAPEVDHAPARRRGPVTAHLTRVDPASVFRVWLVFSVVGLAAFLAAVAIAFAILGATGALAAGERLLNSAGIGHHFRFSLSWILTRLALAGLVLVALTSCLAACGAMIYNAVSGVMGGIEFTLGDGTTAQQHQQRGEPQATRRPARSRQGRAA